jgi:hypothetical protein
MAAAGCSTSSTTSSLPGSGGNSGGAAGTSASGGSAGTSSSSSTVSATGGSTVASGGTSTVASGGAAGATTGASTASGGAGGGATSGTGGAGGSTPVIDAGGPTQESADLIAATLDNGWLQLFDTGGPISAFGPWSTYSSAGSTCAITPAGKPSKSADGMCFGGKGCGATAGGGARVEICKTYPAYQHWTVMVNFCAAHGMTGNNVSYGFGSCNTGHVIAAIHWEGAIPAGAVIDLHDPTDQSMAKLPVSAGATAVTLPGNVDGGKVASILFHMDGAAVPTWSFCISKLWFSYR